MYEQNTTLTLINENNQLVQKLPECLSKHIQIYENIHKDIDSYDHLSMSHFRTNNQTNESYTKQLINVSAEFVNIVSKIKNNYITLGTRFANAKEHKDHSLQETEDQTHVNNFDLFVSQHCENSAEKGLKDASDPLILDQQFERFIE